MRKLSVGAGDDVATAPDLAAFLENCAAGDRSALARLYRATSPQLFGLALRMVRRRDLAEEVLQDAFVAVWRHAGSFDRRRGPAFGWVAAIVRNQAIDLLRRRGREAPLDPEAAAALPDPEPGPLDRAAQSELARVLAGCLGELEEGPRSSILLAYYEGLTYEEAALRLATPVGTVKSWIRRSLMRLKRCLER
jgi:RNA polymerase sigma-70 factor (ECF subfamily)